MPFSPDVDVDDVAATELSWLKQSASPNSSQVSAGSVLCLWCGEIILENHLERNFSCKYASVTLEMIRMTGRIGEIEKIRESFLAGAEENSRRKMARQNF